MAVGAREIKDCIRLNVDEFVGLLFVDGCHDGSGLGVEKLGENKSGQSNM